MQWTLKWVQKSPISSPLIPPKVPKCQVSLLPVRGLAWGHRDPLKPMLLPGIVFLHSSPPYLSPILKDIFYSSVNINPLSRKGPGVWTPSSDCRHPRLVLKV